MRHALLMCLQILLVMSCAWNSFALAQDETESGPQYRLIGPYVSGRAGRVTGVAGDPLTYYLATAAGGVWKSSNGGQEWEAIFDETGVSSIGSVAVAPSASYVVYVGTGEANIRGNVGKGQGIYQPEGNAVLEVHRRGRQKGSHRHLTAAQEKSIQKLMTDKMPDQIKLAYALWTRKAVMELIEREIGLAMSIRTMGEYLKRWGFTPQKPLKRAYEQTPKAVEDWLQEEYPEIKARAQRESVEIYWGDETVLRNDRQHERGYALKGQTPVVKLNV